MGRYNLITIVRRMLMIIIVLGVSVFLVIFHDLRPMLGMPAKIEKNIEVFAKNIQKYTENGNREKKEARHVAFLKVHKAASTTAQNIFLRFGKSRNLTFVIPRVTKFVYPNIISLTESITSENIYPPPAHKAYDILCCHVLYNRMAFQSVMPADTYYIGIVREPFTHFLSTLNYIRPKEIFKIKAKYPVSTFLKGPTNYISKEKSSRSFVNNRMALEYDFPGNVFKSRNKTEIGAYLHKLDSEFDLVIVVERFDESLVMMRRILNWSMKDVLYVKKNVIRTKSDDIMFNASDVDRYKQWTVLDYALYDYFFRRLVQRIHREGEDFQHELHHFKAVRKTVELFCLFDQETPLKVNGSIWSEPFHVTKEDCMDLFEGEIRFILKLRRAQYPGMHFDDKYDDRI